MGGMGSGRHWYFGGKDTTNDYRVLDVRRWQRDGLLRPNQTFGWQWKRNGETVASIQVRTESDQVILKYRHKRSDEDWQDKSYPIRLDWTACHYGGVRPWFLCPARGCGRRVAILYGGGIFACRHCRQLAYPSQREITEDRAVRRADKIRDRLGWEPGILNGRGWEKPKGMRWGTFWRLVEDHDVFVHRALTGMARRFDIQRGSIPQDA
jgi:hypothetical protein